MFIPKLTKDWQFCPCLMYWKNRANPRSLIFKSRAHTIRRIPAGLSVMSLTILKERRVEMPIGTTCSLSPCRISWHIELLWGTSWSHTPSSPPQKCK